LKEIINIETWNRKEHFLFFSKFEEPFWGVTVDVDFTALYLLAKEKNVSFYSSYLFLILRSINQVEQMRYRYDDKNVYQYSQISVSPTVLREDGTFGFSYVDFSHAFPIFQTELQQQIEKVKDGKGLNLGEYRDDVIHFSALPWLEFRALSHARSFKNGDSCPKISVGKLVQKKGRRIMPLSIHVNHALVDGYHVSQFFSILNESILNCDEFI
jgi:chloramphenicol O-acetyltransferase type A